MTIAVGRAPQRGWFDILDDWLKRDRFVFVGWSGILLFPTAYMAIGGWLTASTLSSAVEVSGIKGKAGTLAATRCRSFLIKLNGENLTDQQRYFLAFHFLAGELQQPRLAFLEGLADLLIQRIGICMLLALNRHRDRTHAQGQFDDVHSVEKKRCFIFAEGPASRRSKNAHFYSSPRKGCGEPPHFGDHPLGSAM